MIDKLQNSFVQSRSIFDNIIIVHESIYSMRRKKNGRLGFAAPKLDISKVYDRVELDYLEGMLHISEFPNIWVSLIMMCVKTI